MEFDWYCPVGPRVYTRDKNDEFYTYTKFLSSFMEIIRLVSIKWITVHTPPMHYKKPTHFGDKPGVRVHIGRSSWGMRFVQGTFLC